MTVFKTRITQNLAFSCKDYLSSLVRYLLKRVGKSASENGWPTEVIDGKKDDDFSMKIETKNCQMVNFMCSVGEEDIKPYCTFADFTTAETLGLGLKQISSIDSGTCSYCFYKKGKVHWPEAMQSILNNPAKKPKIPLNSKISL